MGVLFLLIVTLSAALFTSASSFTKNIPKTAFTATTSLMSSSSSSSSDTTTKHSPLLKNSAFVFVKPHANCVSVQDLVRDMLLSGSSSLHIKSEGDISASIIDEKRLIDQHYYAIASKATLLDPADMAVPADKFEDFFGEKWEDVLKSNRAANALQACTILGVDAKGLEKIWRDCEDIGDKVVKLGGGFYCGLLSKSNSEPIYVFNAFFMSMRSKFTTASTSFSGIHYYEVEWNPADLSWADFRAKLLGPTDPETAPQHSIRNAILENYTNLGLDQPPNRGDNGVHASASPLEGLAEKLNWMGLEDIKSDPFGRALLNRGVSHDTVKEWSVDPRVTLPNGTICSIFDALEDTDVGDCLDLLVAINNKAKTSS